MNTSHCICPACGSQLAITAVTKPEPDRTRWMPLREASRITSEPPSRLRRLVRSGKLAAKVGSRGSYLVRPCDIVELVANLPPAPTGHTVDDYGEDEIARLRNEGRRK